jgi:hypothetical protein
MTISLIGAVVRIPRQPVRSLNFLGTVRHSPLQGKNKPFQPLIYKASSKGYLSLGARTVQSLG